jgi:hypothetical protein
MSVQTMAGTCHACHALVDLRAAVPSAANDGYAGESVQAAAPHPAPLPVPLPARLHVEERGRDLVIVYRWFTWTYIFLAFFCVMWNGFLAFWYGAAFVTDAPLAFKLFPLLHVAVGLGLTYMTAAGFVNRTTFTVERDHLAVRHGPLPWRGNLDVSTLALEQLFCSEKVIRSRSGTTLRYGVEAVLKDGTQLHIAPALDEREQAMYIEQSIEKHLGIRDRPVASEMPRVR